MSALRSREVLELGAQLVAQLDRKDDVLALWMSHYIAELIDNVNKATPETKPAAQEVCVKAILELWKRRSSWPEKARPYAKLEPILRVLESLDAERTTGRYYPRERHEALAKADQETRAWLDFAINVDDAARFLIRAAIRAATASMAASSAPWVALTKNAELDEHVEDAVLEFAVKADEVGNEDQVREANVRFNLSKIDAFLEAGVAFADEVRSYLGDDFLSVSMFSSLPLFTSFSLFSVPDEESDAQDNHRQPQARRSGPFRARR